MNKRVRLICCALLSNGDNKLTRELYNMEHIPNIDVAYKQFLEIRCGVITRFDDDYPSYFLDLAESPLVLFYYGNKDLLFSPLRLGVVGTREPSDIGLKACFSLLKETIVELALNGQSIVIVSGMARGIDVAASRIALDLHQGVISYLGSGIDRIYPSDSADVYQLCKEGRGLVLSEYPLNSKPVGNNFPYRNRLIAATSHGIFVPEARTRSGTSSTITWSLELGKSIAAVPTEFSSNNDLTNALIRDGAEMIVSSAELLLFLDEIRTQYRF